MRKKLSVKVLEYICLSLIMIIQIIPLVTVFLNSLSTASTLTNHLIDFSFNFHFENYPHVWGKGHYLISYRNSLIIGVGTTLLVVIVDSLAAYSVTKLKPYCKGIFLGYLFVSVSIPSFTFLVPTYFIFTKLGLVNTYFGLILIIAAMQIPFNLLLLQSFFLGIPNELQESAKIDGCNEFQTLFYIIRPLAKPIITTVSLLTFVASWNDFLFSNTFMQSDNLRTVAVRFYLFSGRYSTDYAAIYSAAAITILPIIIIYLILQKSFIEGMVTGSIKG